MSRTVHVIGYFNCHTSLNRCLLLLIGLLLTLCFSLTKAQEPINNTAQKNLDSLWGIWIDKSHPDTIRCKAIDDLAWEGFVYSNPDSALVLAGLLYDFSLEKDLLKWQSTALNTLGVSHWMKTDYVTAINYYEKNLALSRKIGNQKGIATSLNNIGAIYHNRGAYPKSIEYFKQSQQLHEEIQDTHGIAVSIENIGQIYIEQNDNENALKKKLESLALYEKLGEKMGIAKTLVSIGSIYARQGQHEEGLEHYLKALKMRREVAEKRGVVSSLEMIANLLTNMNRPDEALPYLEEAVSTALEINDKRGYANSMMEYGRTYLAKGNLDKAISYCQQAYDSLMMLDLKLQQKKACICLYQAYRQKGNDTKALQYLELTNGLEDSLQVTETAKILQRMEFEKKMLADSAAHYATELELSNRHQQEILSEQNIRNLSIAGGTMFLLLAVGLYRRSRFRKRANKVLQMEKNRSEELLLNILPHEVAEELKITGKSEARDFDEVTVLFTDFIEFTETAQKLTAKELVNEINTCFRAFDEIIGKYHIEKIKTIGDAYMAAGGLHVPKDSIPADVVRAALEMQEFMLERKAKLNKRGLPSFDMRVGIHTGPVVAGIVGVMKFQYDIWGDTVNTASRMESHGEVGKVNVSGDTYRLVKSHPDFNFESRGKIEAKGKGELDMYFIKRKKSPNDHTAV